MKKLIIILSCLILLALIFIQGLTCSQGSETPIKKGMVQDSVVRVVSNESSDSINNTQKFNELLKSHVEDSVWICNSQGAVAYHKRMCRGLKKCKSRVFRTSINTATNKGLRKCKICY